MRELDALNIVEYLRESGWLEPDAEAHAEELAWGVSNIVLRINVTDGDDIVVKQSREKLRTEIDWFSRLDRVWREADVLQTLSELPDVPAPRLLFQDRENYVLGMSAIDAGHTVWKSDLLEGKFDFHLANGLGRTLALIHRNTSDKPELAKQLGDKEVFDQLRIDPFYRHIAMVHPDIHAPVSRLIDETMQTSGCVVLGDFSPKNILLTAQGPVLVDFETGHYGDPAFDLGFFLSHLCLKTVLHADRRDQAIGLPTTFWERYIHELAPAQDSILFSTPNLQRRAIANLAGCMLARIDGKSPVDYLPDEPKQEFVRSFCKGLFHQPPKRLEDVFEELHRQLQ